MSVTIEVSSVFGMYTNNRSSIEAEGNTVGECLEDLFGQYPKMRNLIMDEKGKLRPRYNIFINGKNIYWDMTMPVNDGDKLNLLMLIYGG